MRIHTPFCDATRLLPCNHVAAPNEPSATPTIAPSISHNDPHAPSPILSRQIFSELIQNSYRWSTAEGGNPIVIATMLKKDIKFGN